MPYSRSDKRRTIVPSFSMEIHDETDGTRLKNKQVRTSVLKGRRRIWFVVARPGHEFSVKVRVTADVWDKWNSGYDWLHLELKIDGQYWASRGIQRPADFEIRNGVDRTWTFNYARNTMKPFTFALRHNYEADDDMPFDHVAEESEVGQIQVNFRSARSRPPSREQRRYEYQRERRRSRDYSNRIAKQLRMDFETKEKHSACRMNLGESQGQLGYGGRRPYYVVNQDDPTDVLCSSTVKYDNAENLRLKAWLDPARHKSERIYFPNISKEEWDEIDANRREALVDLCDLMGKDANWGKTTKAKMKARKAASSAKSSSDSKSSFSKSKRIVEIDLTDETSSKPSIRSSSEVCTNPSASEIDGNGGWKDVVG